LSNRRRNRKYSCAELHFFAQRLRVRGDPSWALNLRAGRGVRQRLRANKTGRYPPAFLGAAVRAGKGLPGGHARPTTRNFYSRGAG
jgi:hypothetical protein